MVGQMDFKKQLIASQVAALRVVRLRHFPDTARETSRTGGPTRRMEMEGALLSIMAKPSIGPALQTARGLLSLSACCVSLADADEAHDVVADEIEAWLPLLRAQIAGCRTKGEVRAWLETPR
jgi:hypothetical protein